MENLYIKVENNKPVNHPLLESNLLQIHQIAVITEEFLKENGYARFERIHVPESKVVVAEKGYELGEDGIVRTVLVTEDLTQEQKINDWVRGPRNFWLARSDWTQTVDAPLTPEKKLEWAEYRQELRDLPAVYADQELNSSTDVVLPTRPE